MDESAYPQPIKELIAAFRELPGVGRRTAERLILSLLDWDPGKLEALGQQIKSLQQRVTYCRRCGNYAEEELCAVCRTPSRETGVICVVEQASQIPVIEQSRAFSGLYHVLGGRIDPLEEQGPEKIRLDELERRLKEENIEEVIIATGSDVEGEATATYVAEVVTPYSVRTSRIASGLPVGADLSFADTATICTALRARQPLREEKSE